MLNNRNILFFADDWGRHPSTMQHIGKILAVSNKIVWVGSLAHRRPTIHLSDIQRIFGKLKKIFLSHEQDISPDIPVIEKHFFIIPFHDTFGVQKINAFLLRLQIRKLVKENNFENFVIISNTPLIADILGTLGESSSHYLCLDDYSFFEGAFQSLISMETRMLEKVSTAHYVSEVLQNSRPVRSGLGYFLPQGVDTEHFKKMTPAREVESFIGKKVIGFFGLVAEYIDIALIKRCAQRYPDYEFLIIGGKTIDLSMWNECPNIHYLGRISYDELPAYASCFSVGIIPFMVNELTVASNPLKLLEYFSLGISVVSTNLPEVERFNDAAFVAKTYDEFVLMIEQAVHDDSPTRIEKRLQLAKNHSWQKIAENLSSIIIKAELSSGN